MPYMECESIINILLSACTVFLSVVAVYISIITRWTSNKQFLFDKRFNAWSILHKMLNLYSESREHAKKIILDERKSDIMLDYLFLWMTTDSIFEESSVELGLAVYEKDNAARDKSKRALLSTIDKLRDAVFSFQYLFPAKLSKTICAFCNNYLDFLVNIYHNEYEREHGCDTAQAAYFEIISKSLRSLDESYATLIQIDVSDKISALLKIK